MSRSREHELAFPAKFEMATALVRAALCSFLTDPDFLDDGECSKTAKEEVRKFLQAITEDDCSLNLFDKLAASLMKALEKCFFSCVSSHAVCRSKLVKREKAWSAFHLLRIGEVGKMWCDFLARDGIPN